MACPSLCPNYLGLSGDDTICRDLVLKLLRVAALFLAVMTIADFT